MATIIKRGTRSEPKFFVSFRQGNQQRTKLLKGIIEKADARQELARVERELAAGRDPFPEPVVEPAPKPVETVGQLLDRWAPSLTNRNADDDRSRVKTYLKSRFGELLLADVDLPAVMRWIDDLKDSKKSAQTQRHALNTLSRFFSWAIARGLATTNPVKMVPQGLRPVGAVDRERPWLEDEAKVPELMKALGGEVGLMFYLSNRSGLRLGEVCGLRMGDLDFLDEGAIRVGHSYDGPLKEDKKAEGKVKWVPAPVDAQEVLKLHLRRRRQLQQAKDDDLVFPFVPAKTQNRRRTSTWTGYRKEHVEKLWEGASKKCGVALSWYEATRHAFVSRSLKNGAPARRGVCCRRPQHAGRHEEALRALRPQDVQPGPATRARGLTGVQ
jgi:integrase